MIFHTRNVNLKLTALFIGVGCNVGQYGKLDDFQFIAVIIGNLKFRYWFMRMSFSNDIPIKTLKASKL